MTTTQSNQTESIEAIPTFDEQLLDSTSTTNSDLQTGITQESAPEISPGGIGAIGIDGKALLFQIINFVILFIILKKFLFKPVAKILENRQRTIEESIKNAKDIETQKANWEQEYQKLQKQTAEKSAKIIDEAKLSAQKLKHEMLEEARQEQENMVENAKEQIVYEKNKSIKEIKGEMLGLVSLAVEKVTKQTVDSQKNKEIINKTVTELG